MEPSPSQKKLEARRSDSVEEYLRLKDASRPSFSKRSTRSTLEVASHVKPLSKGLDGRLPAIPDAGVNPGELGDGDSEAVERSSQSPVQDSLGRRDKAPSPVLERRSNMDGTRQIPVTQNHNLLVSEDSSCGTPTPVIDPPCSPSSSQRSPGRSPTPVQIPNVRAGRSQIPLPTLSDCRSNVSSPTNSDYRSSIPSPTPSYGSTRREGNHTFGWTGGSGSEIDPLSPKTCFSDAGHASPMVSHGLRESHFSDGEDGITKWSPKHKLFKSKLPRPGKNKAVSGVQKGTKLKQKQESRLNRLLRGA